jgi:hypothetical protein
MTARIIKELFNETDHEFDQRNRIMCGLFISSVSGAHQRLRRRQKRPFR